MKDNAEIYCPCCAYRPQSDDVWECIPSCGTLWNTFWTRAVCPGCGYHWQKTQCPACGELSPHDDWYHYPEGRSASDAETIKQPISADYG